MSSSGSSEPNPSLVFKMQRARLWVSTTMSCYRKMKVVSTKVWQRVLLGLQCSETALSNKRYTVHGEELSSSSIEGSDEVAPAPPAQPPPLSRIHPALIGSSARASADADEQTSKWDGNLASHKIDWRFRDGLYEHAEDEQRSGNCATLPIEVMECCCSFTWQVSFFFLSKHN